RPAGPAMAGEGEIKDEGVGIERPGVGGAYRDFARDIDPPARCVVAKTAIATAIAANAARAAVAPPRDVVVDRRLSNGQLRSSGRVAVDDAKAAAKGGTAGAAGAALEARPARATVATRGLIKVEAV